MAGRTRVAAALAGVLLLLAGLAGAQWARGGWPWGPDYRGTGVVVRLLPPPSDLHATRPVIIIHHDPIAGLMDETMDMPFIAASRELFRDLRAGDRIAFGLQATPDALLVVSIKRLLPPHARSTSD